MGQIQAERIVEIDAPLERCYEIISDLGATPEWQETMNSIEVLESDSEGRPTLCRIKSDAKVREVTTQMRFSHHPPDRMSWDQEKGDLKSLHGEWKLEAVGEGKTRATYSLDGDPGRMLGMLLRGPVMDKVTDMMTKDPTEGLKHEAEAG